MLYGSVLAAAYFLSGSAALVYQVVWLRQLGLVLGHSPSSTGTVLAVYMAGLSGGAYLASQRTDTLAPRDAVRRYAVLEALIAAAALLLPYAVGVAQPLLAWAYANGTQPAVFGAVRTAVAAICLGVPTLAMGATFPLVVTARHGRGDTAGWMYGVNTAGAAAGAVAAGFWLVPAFGTFAASLCGVALSVASAAIVLAARPPDGAAVEPPRRKSPRSHHGEPRHEISMRLAMVAAALSGAVVLAYEVAWTRLIALAIGPTTYAFSLMLAVFITGLAGGALVAARVGTLVHRRTVAFATAQILGALAAAVAARAVNTLPLRVAGVIAGGDRDFGTVFASEVTLVALLLLPMALALGAGFPLVLGAAAGGATGARAGRIYAANTVGAILGALVAGHVLLPEYGARQVVLGVGVAGAVGASVLAVITTQRLHLRLAVAAGAVATVGLAAWLPNPNLALLSSGAYKYAANYRDVDVRTALEAGDLLFYEDGPSATVTVRKLAGVTSLAIDGKVDASNGGDMLTQKLLAHLPLLIHPAPADVLVLGLGSGVTAGAALAHPIARLDTLEISRGVVAASDFFREENRRALDDPRHRLVVGDGRIHAGLATTEYDVIVSEPSNPWMSGIATLFTREFFAAARRRLKPGGIMCQWSHSYDMSRENLESIVATFGTAFPHVSVWLVGEGDVLLIGSATPFEDRLSALGDGFARGSVADDLSRVGVTSPDSLLAMLLGTRPLVDAFAPSAVIQRDENAPLEFSAPRALYGPRGDNPTSALVAIADRIGRPAPARQALASGDATEWLNRGRMFLAADAHASAAAAFARAVALAPDDDRAVSGWLDAAAPLGRGTQVKAELEALADASSPSQAARLGLSRLAAAAGDFDTAVNRAQQVVSAHPDDPRGWEQLASIAADANNADALASVVGTLQSRFPARPLTPFYEATLEFLRGQYRPAIVAGQRAIQRDPRLAKAYNLVGAAHANLGDTVAAEQAFEAAIVADPTDVSGFLNSARLELTRGDRQRARMRFSEALVVSPSSPEALTGLADLLERRGEIERANALRQRLPR